MIRSTSLVEVVLLVVALATAIGIEEHRLNTERSNAAVAALNAVNMTASRDSTRNVALENRKVAALLGDSLRLVERQVFQVAQRSDALDRALGRERRAHYIMNVGVDSLHATASAPSVVDTSHKVHRAVFDLRQPPYTMAAAVEIKEQLDSARIEVNVTLDPIHLAARVTCSPPNDQGIRSATIVAMTPPWASVHFDRVEQSPELCASRALLGATRSHRLLGFPSLVFGAGRVVNSAAVDRGDCLSALERSSGADDNWNFLINSFAYDESSSHRDHHWR
jgi:hypothetical protein